MRFGPLLRCLPCALATALFVMLAAPSLSDAAGDAPPEPAAIEDDITVGTELITISDVTLRRASLVKGTRVNVTKLSHSRGRLSSLDLELPDGYVMKQVAIGTVRAYFRVAPESTTAR